MNPTHSPDDATRVQELMRRATEGYTYDTAQVVREAARRGRRQKRTHAAAVAGLGVAAVALFATVAVYGVSSAGELATPAADTTGTASATRKPAPTTPATTSSSPTQTPARERTFAFAPDLLADQLATAVAAQIPGSRTSAHATWSLHLKNIAVTDVGEMQARLDKRDPFEGASIVLDDGLGASQVMLLIADNDSTERLVDNDLTCRTLPDGTPLGTTCQDRDDGSIMLVREHDTEARPEGTVVSNSVTVMTADGWMISATSRNSPAEKYTTITRPQPALAVGDLTTLVLRPDWLTDTQ